MIKNASFLRAPTMSGVYDEALERGARERALRTPVPLELETRGFVPPNGGDLVERHGDCALLAIGHARRVVPASAVAAAVDERCREHEGRTGRKPDRRLRNEIKEAVLAEMLPQALIAQKRTLCYIDPVAGLFVADAASDKELEACAAEVREALGSFAVRPVTAGRSADSLMTYWLQSGEPPDGLRLGEECELIDPADTATTVKFRNHELHSAEVREHVARGMWVTKLGLIYDDRISFVLDAKLKLRKIRFTDVVTAQLEDGDFAATFALMSLELRRLFARLFEVLEVQS